MALSMTAFTSRDLRLPGVIAHWEIRSVNHRYLEVGFKLPELLRDLEYSLREIIKQNISRGKVDCLLKLDQLEDNKTELLVDYQLIAKLMHIGEEVKERFPSTNSTVSLFDILRWPSVIKMQDKDLSTLVEELQGTFELAVQDLVETRAREGSKLKFYIQERLAKIEEHVLAVSKRQPEFQILYRNKIHERLKELQKEIDKDRFEQELAFLLQKMDISEELDRLKAHLEEVERVLELNSPMGRRLDFLMQELNRETNTIASKAVDKKVAQLSIELKVLIEEMREQIQNIE